MKKVDGRKLNTEAQQQMRYTAVRLRKSGKTYAEAAKILGVSPMLICKCWKKYIKYGFKGLDIKKSGVSTWINCKLNSEQMEQLKNILIRNTPDKLELEFSLWTRQAVQNLIYKIWKIKVCLVTVGRYLKKLGFTPQKPVRRAYEQDPVAVNKWFKETYPKIAKKAKKEGAEIHWLDETGLNTHSKYLRGYALKGKTPMVKMKAKRMNLNIISSISKLGKMRFMTYRNALDTKILIKFVNRLIQNIDKKLFIIMDNLAVHHSKKFMKLIEQKCDKVAVFYLPSYSPELNPDEKLNRDLKTHFHSGLTVKNFKEFRNKTVSYLRKIQRSPVRILNYFNSKIFLDYAA